MRHLLPALLLALTAAPAAAVDADSFELSGAAFDRQGALQRHHPHLDAAGAWYGGIGLSYARDPLTWRNPDDTVESVVGHQLSARALAGYTATDWLRIDVDVPTYPLVQVEDEYRQAMGDLRLGSQVSFKGATARSPTMGLAPFVRLPTGSPGAYVSRDGPSGGLTVNAGSLGQSLSWTVEGGLDLSPTDALGDRQLGSTVVSGAGASVLVTRGIRLGAELDARFSLPGQEHWTKNQYEVHAFSALGSARAPRCCWQAAVASSPASVRPPSGPSWPSPGATRPAPTACPPPLPRGPCRSPPRSRRTPRAGGSCTCPTGGSTCSRAAAWWS